MYEEICTSLKKNQQTQNKLQLSRVDIAEKCDETSADIHGMIFHTLYK
jgi:hypothetical protein